MGNGVGREGAIPQRSNVLLVILDDVGLDAVGCYPGSNDDAITPAIDALASGGLRFETVWAYPSCSPTRSTIMTGQYGFRTGIGAVVRLRNDDPGLENSVTTLPERMRASSPKVRTAFLGKWHLSGAQHGLDHAREQGFEHFRGTVGNLGDKGQKKPYFAYNEIVDGKKGRREAYATTAVTDDTLAAIERFGSDDWFVVASYHAAHRPLHAPPPELRTLELSGLPRKSRHVHFAAMVEALDREIGRLWESIPDAVRARTTIIVVGDNGGASGQMTEAVRTARGKERPVAGKGSLEEPGVRVPLVIAGAAVAEPGRVISELAGTSDLFDTSVELLAGPTSPAETPDSVSLL
ncbi:MAG: sulfatase-like hydrolase/transferase, partial [Planctomycetota bacterium]